MKQKTGIFFLIYTAAAAIIAAIIRFFQYVSVIDFETGFFRKGSEPMGYLIYIVQAVWTAGLVGLVILGTKKKWTATTVSSAGMGGKATIILGAPYLIAAVMKVYQLVSAEGGSLFRTIAMVSAALFFAAMGLLLMKSTVPPAVSGFLNIFPALIMFSQAIELFMDDLVIKNRSDNLLLLLIYIFATLFFAGCARFYGRIETKTSRPREIIMAGLVFIFSGTHVIAKLLALAFGGSAVQGMSAISPDAVSVMLISGAFLAVLCTTEQKLEIEYIIEKKEEKNEE